MSSSVKVQFEDQLIKLKDIENTMFNEGRCMIQEINNKLDNVKDETELQEIKNMVEVASQESIIRAQKALQETLSLMTTMKQSHIKLL